MASQTQTDSLDQFLTIDETASLIGIAAADLRLGIACGLVPIRRDNQGRLRIHRAEVPDDLLEQLERSEVDLPLQVASLQDEVLSLREQLEAGDKFRNRLETLLEQQSDALTRTGGVLDKNEADIGRLTTLLESSMRLLDQYQHLHNTYAAENAVTNASTADAKTPEQPNDSNAELQKSQQENARLQALLQRAMAAIEASENLTDGNAAQLTSTTDKAMQMLERAVNDAENAKSDVARMSELMDRSLSSSTRIENEIDQRNGVIDKQHELMNRLITVSEQSLSAPNPKAKLKRSFWQRLWGKGKGI